MRTVNPIFGKPVSFVDLFSSKFRLLMPAFASRRRATRGAQHLGCGPHHLAFQGKSSRWASGLALCLSLFFIGVGAQNLAAAPAFVQGNSATPQTPQTTVTVALSQSQKVGNLNVVIVGWNDTSRSVSSVADSLGNSYYLAVGATTGSGISETLYCS